MTFKTYKDYDADAKRNNFYEMAGNQNHLEFTIGDAKCDINSRLKVDSKYDKPENDNTIFDRDIDMSKGFGFS